MNKRIFLFFLAATLAVGLTPLLRGGSRTGSLGGEVMDPSGSVVPGAKIFISGDNWSEILSTDETGQYDVTGLAPGRYEVAVRSNGFAPFERAGLVVSAGDTTRMDAILDLAVLKQEVTITPDAYSPVEP